MRGGGSDGGRGREGAAIGGQSSSPRGLEEAGVGPHVDPGGPHGVGDLIHAPRLRHGPRGHRRAPHLTRYFCYWLPQPPHALSAPSPRSLKFDYMMWRGGP
jgi:hypothetical protein